MSLKERALAAYEKSQAEVEQQRRTEAADRMRRRQNEMVDLFDRLGIKTNALDWDYDDDAQAVTTEIDEITFGYFFNSSRGGGKFGLHVGDGCDCGWRYWVSLYSGADVTSNYFLADLGSALEQIESQRAYHDQMGHHGEGEEVELANTDEPPPRCTPEERSLLDSLHKLAESHVPYA